MTKEEIRKQLRARRKDDLVNDIVRLFERLTEEHEQSEREAEEVIEEYGYVSTPGQCAADIERTWSIAKYICELAFDIENKIGLEIKIKQGE